LAAAASKAGIELDAVGASTSSDVADAALALCARRPDAVVQISDNLTGITFTGIAQAAQRAHLPIFSFNSAQAKQGASVVLARDFYDGGREAALIAARVMRGESATSIPFAPTKKTRLLINAKMARTAGLTIPPAVLKRAEVIEQ
jgi:putative ABC transport system substrate-binding protein